MPRKKTNEEFLAELNRVNPMIEPLEPYINSSTKIKVKCKNCSYIWLARPTDILRGHGCIKCVAKERVKHRAKSFQDFCDELKKVNPQIEITGEYKNTHTDVAYKCLKCNYEGYAKPYSMLQGHGCPNCYKQEPRINRRKTTEQFVRELSSINDGIQVIGDYIKSDIPVLVKCAFCQNKWEATPNALLRGTGCPVCHRNTQTSFIEQFIFLTLRESLVDTIVINRDTESIGKELDIYVPKLKLAFEPGSWYWHKSKLRADKEKRSLCKENGIRLITIYDSYDNKGVIEEDDIYCYDVDFSLTKNIHLIVRLLESVLADYNVDISNLNLDSIIKKAKKNSSRITTEAFIDKLSLLSPNIEIKGNYTSSKEKVECVCKNCGHKWYPIADSLLHGQGCPACSRKCAGEKLRLSQNEVEERIRKNNHNIEVFGTYEGADKKIDVRCLVCNYEWKATPSHLFVDAKCPKCANKIRRTTEFFVDEMKKINPALSICGEYEGRKQKIKVKCNNCNYIWEASPNNLLKGSGCPKCKLHKSSIAIICVETGERFDSIKSAARIKGVSSGGISNALSKRCNTAGGFHWKKILNTNGDK